MAETMDMMVRAENSNVAEARCPFCRAPIRSDASLHVFCKMCGMGVPMESAHLVHSGSETLPFCSRRCLVTYLQAVSSPGAHSWEPVDHAPEG